MATALRRFCNVPGVVRGSNAASSAVKGPLIGWGGLSFLESSLTFLSFSPLQVWWRTAQPCRYPSVNIVPVRHRFHLSFRLPQSAAAGGWDERSALKPEVPLNLTTSVDGWFGGLFCHSSREVMMGHSRRSAGWFLEGLKVAPTLNQEPRATSGTSFGEKGVQRVSGSHCGIWRCSVYKTVGPGAPPPTCSSLDDPYGSHTCTLLLF